MYTQGMYEIISKKETSGDMFDLTLSCKDMSELACAGKFVHISVPGFF